MKSVSIIIPNYNGQSLLAQNLPAVVKLIGNDDELIIIDDHSTDNSVTYLLSQYKLKKINSSAQYDQFSFDQISLIVNKNNLRFAKNVNRAAKFATKELLLLLNSDVLPEQNIKKELASHFENENIFAVSCLEDNNGQFSGKNKLWFANGLFQHAKADDLSEGETAWVSGGSGMFSRAKFVQLNGFDEKFSPAYWEDIDLSFRARKMGWKVLFDPKAKVFHKHESTHSRVFSSMDINHMSWKNGDYFTRKNSNWWQYLMYWLYRPYWLYKRSLIRFIV